MSQTKKSPIKTVHFEDDSSSNENFNETNININISTSPRKKRRPSCTTQMLENELKAEAGRRNSLNIANMAGETANLTLMVSSLRRQNEDLKAKVSELQKPKRTSENLSNIDKILVEQKEVECEDLRKTIANLEKLLSLEREERSANEKSTLALLEDVKKKWHDRDDKRQHKMKKDLEDANLVVQEMEVELQKKSSDLNAAQNDIESLQTVKQSLKAKLKECKSKLEATVANYESKAESADRLQKKISELETELSKKECSERRQKRVSLIINDNRAEVEAIRDEMEKLAKEKRSLESDFSDLKLTSKLAANRLDTLQKEYDSHLARCDRELFKINSEHSKLQEHNEDLEKEVTILEAKLSDKTRALEKLEKVQDELETKMSAISSQKVLDKYASEKTSDLLLENEELKKDNRLLKVEVRLSERKQKDVEGKLQIYKDMYMEQKKKAQKELTDETDLKEKCAKTEKDLEVEKQLNEELTRKNEGLSAKVENLKKEVVELKKEVGDNRNLEEELKRNKSKVSSLEKISDKSEEYQKNYEITKNICLELEDQIKEYEVVIDKLEKMQEKHKETNEELKKKADENATELIKTKREINELKSNQLFKESMVKDLQEKSQEMEKYYETENSSWKVKFEESTKLKKEHSVTIVGLKEQLQKLDKDNIKLSEDNEKLYDQNVKLKEEMTTLITSFHSLKDSHLMLQNTVQELGDKLVAKDDELERKEKRLASVKQSLEKKTIEHQETLNQLKKLNQHLPDRTPKKKEKSIPPFLL